MALKDIFCQELVLSYKTVTLYGVGKESKKEMILLNEDEFIKFTFLTSRL